MDTKLTDRIVVEIKAPQGYELTNEQIANQLRMIADEIDEGMKGNNYTDHMPYEEEHFEVLWEHESVNYGGFKIALSSDSLISSYYYGNTKTRPVVISHDTLDNTYAWLAEYEEKDEHGKLVCSKEDMAEKACDIVYDIIDQWQKPV